MNRTLLLSNAIALTVLLGFHFSPGAVLRRLPSECRITFNCRKRRSWP